MSASIGTKSFSVHKYALNKDPSPAAVPKSVKATSSSSTYTKAGMKSDKKEASDPPDAQLVDKEKSLRERVSEPSAPPAPTILPAKTVVDNDEKKEANIYKVNQKFILADKYRPKALKDFICNRSEATQLQALVQNGVHGHVIFEGPPGVGKRTMIWAMLREAFGPDRVQLATQPCIVRGFLMRLVVDPQSHNIQATDDVLESTNVSLKGMILPMKFEIRTRKHLIDEPALIPNAARLQVKIDDPDKDFSNDE
ncbi:hypothetical protein CRYUN_Cryun07bG0195400 [Craigia yunnanensis]